MLLEAVTGDAFFAPYKENEKQFKGVKSMKGYLDCVKQQGVQQGKQQGIQQGIKQGRIIVYVELVQDKMASTNCSVKEAMDQVGVKKGYRAAVLKQLKASKSA